MGLFGDRKVSNAYDRMFDLNRDGYMNASEQALEYDYIEESTNPSADEEKSYFQDEVDMDELECMDEDERREMLESAEYDSDDFDDF